MSEELEQKKTFQDKMMDRIRDSIGELMSDEDLKCIVEKGTEKAFFERRVVQRGYGRNEEMPSLMDTVIKEVLEARMRKAAEKWFEDNSERVQEAVQKAIDGGAYGCVERHMNSKFAMLLDDLQDRIINMEAKQQ